MVYRIKKLDKAVNHETLETALIKAAPEVGLEISEDVLPEKNGCTQTNFYLKKFFHPTIKVKTYDHGDPIDFYCVDVDDFLGISSKRTVDSYVEKVHEYLLES